MYNNNSTCLPASYYNLRKIAIMLNYHLFVLFANVLKARAAKGISVAATNFIQHITIVGFVPSPAGQPESTKANNINICFFIK